MFLLYSFLYTIAFILMLPLFWFRRDKYAAGFKQRFGILPEFAQDGRPVVWIHCVSVGETNAARPLINKILKNYPNFRIIVSTTTKTGQEFAKHVFSDDVDFIFYFPFDWRWTVRRFFRTFKPEIILIMETELWINFLRESQKNGARVFIINGRLSEKSMNRYAWIPKTMKRSLRLIDAAFMQTSKDAKRLAKLGISNKKIKVTGNFKFDQKKDEREKLLTNYFRERFGFLEENPLIIAASTHALEEKWILEAYKKVYKSGIEKLPRLMIAPRHPERFDEVAKLIERTGFSWIKRSDSLEGQDELVDVILLDSIGELRSVYTLSEIVFVGGSLVPHGGQNILEPALEKNAIVTGHFMSNFQAMESEFKKHQAFIQIPKLEEGRIVDNLAETFYKLLKDDVLREKLSKRAFSIMKKNRGASDRTLLYLKPYLKVYNYVIKK